MNSFNIGPLSIQAAHIFILISLLIAAAAGRYVGRRSQVGISSVLIDMLLMAIVSGRIAFVALWFDQYRAAPFTMLDIRDGGFQPWVGIACALAFGAWRATQNKALREPLAAGVLAGAVAWFVSGAPAALAVQDGKGVPAVTLNTLEGQPVSLAALAQGRPTVVNLWATWCAPCIREMPVFQAAQAREKDIRFVFVNHNEAAGTVAAFLQARAIRLEHVMLDPGSSTARAVGSSGTPTTLFFDAGGQLADAHLGPLSDASLAAKLAQIRPARH